MTGRTGRERGHDFPEEREANRRRLLDAVASVADVLVANRSETEDGRTLAPASVEALRDSGLFKLKAPREVGGAEAHPVVQMDVIEAVIQADPAAAWCMFITSAVAGKVLARVEDEAVDELLADGFPFMVGAIRPGGSATRVDGGFQVSGRWAWGSGAPHADWFSVSAPCDDPATPMISVVLPAADVTVHDNWHALGMRGTGSCDYEVVDAFVPDRFAVDTASAPQRRGGRLYRLGLAGYVVNEHGSFAYGLAQAALDMVVAMAVEKRRGPTGVSIADREVVQRTIGRAAHRIDACRLLMAEVMERMWDEAADGPPSDASVVAAQSAAVWCTDEAVDVIGALFRYAGGTAVMAGDLVQRYLRDVYTVQSHIVVSDASYEAHGRLMLGLEGPAP